MTTMRAETRRRKGVPGVPEPSAWASWKDLERERDSVQWAQEPHGGSGTAGVAKGAGWGEGRTA